jgi:hypothetical protein
VTGTEWQNYTPASGGPAASDTLLELDVSDTSASGSGTVHQDTVAAVTQAGLGLTTSGDTVYGGSSGVPARLAGNTTTTRKFLRQTGTGSASAAPAWDTIAAGDVPTLNQTTTGNAANVTGTVAVANGGTGQTGAAAAFNALSPMTTAGDLIYGGTSGAGTRLAAGTSGYVLTSQGAATAPHWAASGGGSTPLPFTYVAPSGDTTGATDTAAINAVISAGGNAVLAQTGIYGTGIPYYVSAPLTPSTGASLRGAMPWSATPYDTYGAGTGNAGGTVIQAVAGFTGAAVINMTNATGTQYFGVSLADFTVNCSPATSATLEAMHVEGAWGACFMSGVMLYNSSGHCLHFATNATSGFTPDDWHVFRCKFSASYGTTSTTGCGVYADNLPDSWFTDCESSENQSDNWLLNYSLNTTLTRCKGENSAAGAGFHLGGQGGPGRALNMTACTTHLNWGDGFLFDVDGADGATGGIYQLANCTSINDNQAAGTTYAGFRSNGCPNVIMAVGCSAYGAYYGASQTGTNGGMTFTASSLSGTSAALHDDRGGVSRLISSLPVGSPDGGAIAMRAFTV